MEGFKEELQSRLDEAVSGVSARARVTLDTSELDAKADEARARVDELDSTIAEPSIRLDDEGLGARADQARATLDELDSKSARPDIGLESSELDEQVDRAREKLDELSGKRSEPRVSLDTAEFDAKLDEARAKLRAFGSESASPRIGASGGGGGGGGEGGGGSLAGALTMGLGALLPGIGPAVAALGGGALTGFLGLGGVGKALSAAHQASQNIGITPQQRAATDFSNAVAVQQAQNQVSQARAQAAQDAITSAQSIEQAQQNLASVERNSAAQQVQALQSVRQAQQGVEEADYSLSEAQYQLSQAWEQAQEQIRQLDDQLADSRLNVQSAQLAIQQAVYQQRLTNENAYSTDLDRQQAALAVARARQQLTDAQDQETSSAYAANLAHQQGVEGSQTVIQAKQAVTAATYQQSDAHEQYAQAQANASLTQVNNAAQVQQAQMQVAAAEEQAAYQRQTNARSIAQAEQAVTNTIREQQLQMAATESTANQAANEFAKDMSKLSPAAQHVVEQILGMKGAFQQLQTAAQNAIAPGFSDFLTGLSTMMPTITDGVTKMGDALSKGFSALGKIMETKEAKEVFSGLVDNGIKFAEIVVPAFGGFIGELLKIGAQPGAADGLANLIAGIGHALTGLAENVGKYTKPINDFLTAVGTIIAQIGPPLGTIIGQVAKALEPLTTYLNKHPDGTVAKVLGDIVAGMIALNGLKSVIPDALLGPLGKLADKKLFDPLKGALKGLPGMFKDSLGPGGGFDYLVQSVKDLGGKVGDAVSGWASNIGSALKNIMPTKLDAQIFLQSIKDMGSKIGDAVSGWGSNIAQATGNLWTSFGENLSTIGDKLVEVAGNAKQVGSNVADFLVQNGKAAWDGLVTGVTAAKDAMIALKDSEMLQTLWANITAGAEAALDLVMDANPIMLVVIALTAIVAGLIYAYNHVTWFRDLVNDAFHFIADAAMWLWHNVFDPMWQGIEAGATWLYDHAIYPLWIGIKTYFGLIESAANWLWHHVFDPLWQGIVDGASGFIDAFKTAWDKIQDVFKTPVNFLINTVYTNGIEALWNGVVNAIGQNSLDLPNISGFASGGVVPGYAPGQDTVPAMLSPGEGVLVPEAVQALGPETVLALNAQYGRGRVSTPGHYGGGGIIDWITNTAKGGWDSISGFFDDGMDLAKVTAAITTGNTTALNNALGKLVGTNAVGNFAKVMLGVPTTLIHDMVQAIGSMFGGGSSGGGSGSAVSVPGGTPSGNIAQWFSDAVAATGAPASWIPDLETIAHYESGDDPRSINLWDSNAAAGDPSRGIMQTIMSTFLAYHQAGTTSDIYDPVANIASAINYIRATYGDVSNVPGIRSLARGGSYVGYDSGGVAYGVGALPKYTPAPERVLSPRQTEAFERLVAILDRSSSGSEPPTGQGVTVEQHFHGTQWPNAEQQAAMRRELALTLGGAA